MKSPSSLQTKRAPWWSSTELERRLMLAADCGAVVAPTTASQTTTEIVFVDSNVRDFQQLEAGLLASAELVLIDSDRNGIDQISQVLANRHGVRAVHFLAHGAAGKTQLGNQTLDNQSLRAQSQQVREWASAFAPDADILLYGCETGRGDLGTALLAQLAALTGADVAASTDVTGHQDHSGNWVLEKQTGAIESVLAFDAQTLSAYQNHLPITIRAAGVRGEEEMQLQIDGNVVQTWTGIGGNAYAGQYETFTYNGDGISADRIRIAFTNDLFIPDQGIDRNLRIDNLTVDGVTLETEDPSVFSTGTWKPEDGTVSGFRESEFLHTTGYFQFADTASDGSTVAISARGQTGEESMSLLIDGVVVETWTNVDTSLSNYIHRADTIVTADQIRVAFTNDLYQPELNFDRNLVVDKIDVDGRVLETEDPSVFSTGTWKPADGITPGFRQSEALHGNGYFQYDAAVPETGTIGLSVTQVTIDEDTGTARIGLTRYDGSDGAASAFYQTVGVEAVDGSDFIGTDSGRVDFASGQTSADITVSLINDNELEAVESFSVSLFRTEGAELGVPRTAIVTIVDDEAGQGLIGHWRLDESGIGQSVTDASGLGNDGDHTNLASPQGPVTDTPDVDSANPYSLSFDGVNDFVQIPADASLNLSGSSFTQAVWMKPTIDDNAYHGVLGYQPSNGTVNRYPGIWVYQQNRIHAGFGDGSNWNSLLTGEVLTPGVWNHVATTFDGTSYKVFVNGSQVHSTTSFAGRTPVGTNRIDIGRIDNYFEGSLDDVRIYNRALSASEISVLIDGADVPPIPVDGEFVANTLVNGFDTPIAVDWLPDGRMLVAEQDGYIRLVVNNVIQPTPLLDITNIVNSGTKDRGMLGFAVHPDFESNPYIYVSYTYDPPEVYNNSGLGGPDGNGARVAQIARYTVNSNGTSADPNSGVVLVGNNSTYDNIGSPNVRPALDDPHSCFDANGNPIDDCIPSDETSHTIGDLEFGPDGMLYASVGDGGSFGRADPVNLRALDLDSLAGKILRIDPITGQGPSDNPFFDGNPNSNQSKVFNYGLRNPFRLAVNQDSGAVFAGDVGWTQWEEINTGRGANFGWPAFEGGNGTSLQTGRYQDLAEVQAYYATNPDVTAPIWARLHSDGGRAIVMGDFVSGSQYPGQYDGSLLFTDIGDQVLRAANFNSSGDLISVESVSAGLGFLVDIQMADDGYLYYVDIVGSIGRLEFQTG
ncbi:MAG: DUF4347 domain-containing protein [Rubripirellula sp.]